jgi:hypothetical protein
MAKKTKETADNQTDNEETSKDIVKPNINDIEWTDYVLELLTDDEKIKGNPTTDGLRRIFEIALDCTVIGAQSTVVQAPSPENEKRATVTHQLDFILNDESLSAEFKYRSVSGAADVYWGNCDKIYRNHPVAVAETRAEGRALRRALKLRKVVAAEEIVENVEDNPDHNTVSKISNQQINFIDIMSQRLNINVLRLLEANSLKIDNIYEISHDDAVNIIRLLSKYQQNVSDITDDIIGYSKDWK